MPPSAVDHAEALSLAQRNAMGLLCKLSPDNLPVIAPKLLLVRCADGLCPELVEFIVTHAFARGEAEPAFASMFAELFWVLANGWESEPDASRSVSTLLISHLEGNYDNFARYRARSQWERNMNEAYKRRLVGTTKLLCAVCNHFLFYEILHAQLMSLLTVHRDPFLANEFLRAIDPTLLCHPYFGPTPAQRRELLSLCRPSLGRSPHAHTAPFSPFTRDVLCDLLARLAHGRHTELSLSRIRRFWKMCAVLELLGRAFASATPAQRSGLLRLPLDLIGLVCTHISPEAVWYNAEVRRQLDLVADEASRDARTAQ